MCVSLSLSLSPVATITYTLCTKRFFTREIVETSLYDAQRDYQTVYVRLFVRLFISLLTPTYASLRILMYTASGNEWKFARLFLIEASRCAARFFLVLVTYGGCLALEAISCRACAMK